MLRAAISASETTMPLGYWPVSSSQRTGRPVLVVGGRDQLDNHAITDEGLGAPILADEGKQPVLDFVPLAGDQHAQRVLIEEVSEARRVERTRSASNDRPDDLDHVGGGLWTVALAPNSAGRPSSRRDRSG